MEPDDLVELRHRLGLTRSELARLTGYSVSRLSEYEAGVERIRGRPPRPAPIPYKFVLALERVVEKIGTGQVEVTRSARGPYRTHRLRSAHPAGQPTTGRPSDP